jgi:hypothetical protein
VEKMMTASEIIAIAKKHKGKNSSADLCLLDAIYCEQQNLEDHAKKRAIHSLAYSVGIFHPDYIKVTNE